MIVVTSETITGKRIVETLGIVRGNTVRARHIGRDIMAGLRNIVGARFTNTRSSSRRAASSPLTA